MNCEERVGWSHVANKKTARRIAGQNTVSMNENFIGSVTVDDMKVIGHGEITIASGAAVGYMKKTNKNTVNIVNIPANGLRVKKMGKTQVHFSSGGGGAAVIITSQRVFVRLRSTFPLDVNAYPSDGFALRVFDSRLGEGRVKQLR